MTTVIYPRAIFLPTLLMSVLLGLAACAPHRVADTGQAHSADTVMVEGRVSMRGNVPFARPVLITADNNWYVLRLTEEQRAGLVTPALVRVIGRVSADDWNGRPITHLDVESIVRIDN